MTSSSSEAGVFQFFDDLVRCETRLYNALNDRLRREHGIVTSQFEFLRFLRDHPGSRVADVAATFAIGIGATSRGADRLEREGWVQRAPHPADGRSSLLGLTDEGTELVAAAERTATRALAQLVGDTLGPDRLAATAATLAVLRAELEQDRTGTPIG